MSLTDAHLDRIAEHHPRCDDPYSRCETLRLVAEVRRLRAAIGAHRDGHLLADQLPEDERALERGDLDVALWMALGEPVSGDGGRR